MSNLNIFKLLDLKKKFRNKIKSWTKVGLDVDFKRGENGGNNNEKEHICPTKENDRRASLPSPGKMADCSFV